MKLEELLVEVKIKQSLMSRVSHEFTLKGLDHRSEVTACNGLALLPLILEKALQQLQRF